MDSFSDSPYSVNKNKTESLSVFFKSFILLEINIGKYSLSWLYYIRKYYANISC